MSCFLRHSPFSLFMLVLQSPYFFASFLPPPATFWAVSPSSLNRSSPLERAGQNKERHQSTERKYGKCFFWSVGRNEKSYGWNKGRNQSTGRKPDLLFRWKRFAFWNETTVRRNETRNQRTERKSDTWPRYKRPAFLRVTPAGRIKRGNQGIKRKQNWVPRWKRFVVILCPLLSMFPSGSPCACIPSCTYIHIKHFLKFLILVLFQTESIAIRCLQFPIHSYFALSFSQYFKYWPQISSVDTPQLSLGKRDS